MQGNKASHIVFGVVIGAFLGYVIGGSMVESALKNAAIKAEVAVAN